MLFCSKAKAELARRRSECPRCAKAELSAFVKTDGSIEIMSGGRVSVAAQVDDAAVARRVYVLFKEACSVPSEVVLRKESRLGRANSYIVRVPPSTENVAIMKALRLIAADGTLSTGVPWDLLRDSCCRRAYLRGAFLSSGYVSDPSRGYHLELTTRAAEYASDLVKLLKRFDIVGKVAEHKNRFIVYLKGAQDVSGFLQVVGADQALLEMENIRVVKSVRNSVNRAVNCETANVNKTVSAALRQAEDIRLIESTIGLQALSPQLRAVAEVRLEMPAATMSEIADAFDPKISKSAVNYRFRRLAEIADEIRKGQG